MRHNFTALFLLLACWLASAKEISQYPNVTTNPPASYLLILEQPGVTNWNWNISQLSNFVNVAGGFIPQSAGRGTNSTLVSATNSTTLAFLAPGQNTSIWSWNNSDTAWEFTGGMESDGTLGTYGGLIIFLDNATRIGNLTGGGLFFQDTNSAQHFVIKADVAYGDGSGLTNLVGNGNALTNLNTSIYHNSSITNANNGAVSNVVCVSVSGNLLGTNNGVYIRAYGDYINNSTSTTNLTVSIIYGSTTMFSSTVSVGNSVNRAPFMIFLNLWANNSTSAQSCNGLIVVPTRFNNATGFGSVVVNNTPVLAGNWEGTATEDSTVTKNIIIQVQWASIGATEFKIQRVVANLE